MSEDVRLSAGYMLPFIREFIAKYKDRKFNFYEIIKSQRS